MISCPGQRGDESRACRGQTAWSGSPAHCHLGVTLSPSPVLSPPEPPGGLPAPAPPHLLFIPPNSSTPEQGRGSQCLPYPGIAPNPSLSPHSHRPGEEQRFPIVPLPHLCPPVLLPQRGIEGFQLPPYHSLALTPPLIPDPPSQSRTGVPKTPPLSPQSHRPRAEQQLPGGGTYLWGWHWGFVGCWIPTRLIKPALPHLHISHLHCTAGRGP